MLNKETIRYLLVMAAADGRVSEEELQLIRDRTIRLGVTDDEFEAIIEEVQRAKGELELQVPKDTDDKHKLLAELVRMMGVDGILDEREKSLFAIIAANMDVSTDELHRVIDMAVNPSDTE